MVMRAEPQKRLSTEELMLWNCGAGEDSWESLGLQGDKLANPQGNQPWILIGRTGVEAEAPIPWPLDVKEPTHWKRSWCWERLRAGEEGVRGWDGWMASPTQRTWTWASSRRQWRTGRPGEVQSMGLQRAGHDSATDRWPMSAFPLKPKFHEGWGLSTCSTQPSLGPAQN